MTLLTLHDPARKPTAVRLDDAHPPGQARRPTMQRCRVVDMQMHIEYGQEVPDSTRQRHMKLLETYVEEFSPENVTAWVPNAEDDECEFGVYADSKVVILTRGNAANIAFGPGWREEHIIIAEISWKISEDEYRKTVQDYNNAREWARRAAEEASSA